MPHICKYRTCKTHTKRPMTLGLLPEWLIMIGLMWPNDKCVWTTNGWMTNVTDDWTINMAEWLLTEQLIWLKA